MKFKLRRGHSGDIDSILELRRDSYPAQLDLQLLRRRFEENPLFHLDEDLLVAEYEGRVVASALALPAQCYAPGGKLLSLCGLASVAVHPLVRRQGLAGQLVREVLRLGRERHNAVAGLFAFEYSFYHKFGWAPVGRAERYWVKPEHLPNYHHVSPHGSHTHGERPEGPEMELFSLHEQDWEALALCYHQAESQAGRLAIQRGPGVWRGHLLTPGMRAIGAGVKGKKDGPPGNNGLAGYLLFEYIPCPEQPLLAEIQVHELVALTGAAFRSLIGLLHRLQDQVVRVLYPASPSDPFPLMWHEQRQPSSHMVLGEHYSLGDSCVGMMLRWLDPVASLTGRGYPCLDAQFTLGVIDPLEPSPSFYVFRLCQGIPYAEPLELMKVDVAADVGTWSQIWSGAVTPSQAHRWGRLEVARPELLSLADQVFATDHVPFVHALDCF